MVSFLDKVVLLTGATGDIGQELTRLLAGEGVRLILTACD